MTPAAQRVRDAAATFATERRQPRVTGLHLLYALTALTRPDGGVAGELLTRHAANVAKLNEELARAL
jgi:ATP-dependent Clp protease ATP-binding subunit ClpA